MCPSNPGIVLGNIYLSGCVDTNYYDGIAALSTLQFATTWSGGIPLDPRSSSLDPTLQDNYSTMPFVVNNTAYSQALSFIQATGGATAPGGPQLAAPLESFGGGSATTEFANPGEFISPNSYSGNYSLQIAGLEGQASYWSPNDLHLVFGAPVNLVYDIYEAGPQYNNQVVSCGSILTNNITHCFGWATVVVTNLYPGVTTFTNVNLAVSRTGPGNAYAVGPFVVNNFTFQSQSSTLNIASVPMFLPEGTYQYTASAVAKNGLDKLNATNYFSIVCCTNNCLQVLCPANKTVQCGTNWQFDWPTVVSDCCGTNVQITPGIPTTNGACPWVITQGWLITDTCGNTNTCSQTVTVVDTNPPDIQCPSNIVVTSCVATQMYFSVTASHLCCTNLSVVYSPTNGSFFQPGTSNKVTCWVTDCCSNIASCNFSVTVLQNTNFEVQCPSNYVVYACEETSVAYPPPTVTDPCCGTNWNVTYSPANGSSYYPGSSNRVTCLVWDACGNSNSCSFWLTVLYTNVPCSCIGTYNVLTETIFTNLYSFTGGNDGADPFCGLVLSGTNLYGTTSEGGSLGGGTVFALSTNGTAFRLLHGFNGVTDGGDPWAGLILSGVTLYGTAFGFPMSQGAVFSVGTDGVGFTNLYNFSGGGDGANPYGNLVLSGASLYGTANNGGGSGFGTVFRVNTNGADFTVLYSFTNGSDGSDPICGLVLAGTNLYGTAYMGGSSNSGTVFCVSTNGTGFATLHTFTGGSDGGYPHAGLILSGHTLYGTTAGGGSSGSGTVFALETDGTGFTNLYSFTVGSGDYGTNSDGTSPHAGLLLSGKTLYGTAAWGGSAGVGTVFGLTTNGTGFTVLHTFTGGNDGGIPQAALISSGNTLYGTTQSGGSLERGTVFALAVANYELSCLQIQCTNDLVITSCVPVQVTYSPTVTDLGCSNWIAVCTPPSGSWFAPDTITNVNCVVTDCCGNSNSCSFTVTIKCTNCVPMPTNLVLWLPFDETNGTASANLVSPTNYGTHVGNPTPIVDAYVGNSLSFNGQNQYVTVPDYPAIEVGTNDFTIDAWVEYPSNSLSVYTIVSKRVGNNPYYGFVFDVYENTLLLQLADGGYTSYYKTASVPADGQWHFVAVTVQRTATNGLQFYVDGQPSGGTFNPTGHEGSLSNNTPLVVGTLIVSGTYWLGGIDEVELFNRALAPGEIQEIYAAGSAGKCKACNNTNECIAINCTNVITNSFSTFLPVSYPPPNVTDLCCGTNWTITYSPTNGTWFPATGLNSNVVCVVTDSCGNSSYCSFTVNVTELSSNHTSNAIIAPLIKTNNGWLLNITNVPYYNWPYVLQVSTGLNGAWLTASTNPPPYYISNLGLPFQFYRLAGTNQPSLNTNGP